MKLKIDQEADALYLRLTDGKIIESEQVAPGVIVDFDQRSRVVGVEVLTLSKRVVRSRSHKLAGIPSSTAPILAREKPSRKYGKRT